MNKSQQALDRLETNLCVGCWEYNVPCDCPIKEDVETIKKDLIELETLTKVFNLLKSKLYLPEENDCDTLDDGSKVYMIYTKGVWSEEEYKALKRVA